MKYIYVMKNKVNGKKYIGQTNNFNKRMAGHKSDAFNPNSHSYDSPLSRAIRKYGWENFDNRVIEEIVDEESQSYVNYRESFFIKYYQSLSKENGYNVTCGGAGNIDFKNEKLPHKYSKDLSKKYTTEEIHQIKQDIIASTKYSEIAKKWGLSYGMISLINNGEQWFEKDYNYPLRYCNTSRRHNANTWVREVQQDLIYSSLTLKEISEKYNKAYSTIKKINGGQSHKNNNYAYPLTSNRT